MPGSCCAPGCSNRKEFLWVGSLGVHFEVGGGGITPCLKLVKIYAKNLKFGLYIHPYI